jgi:diacylglycerol kinase (ATP)
MNKFIKGFTFAISGIAYAFRSQVNMRFHIFSALVVVALSFALRINVAEWCIILMCIGSVISAELINTSLEVTIDITSPSYNEKAGNAKDLAAGAVLVVCTVSAIIGIMIFLPKLILLFA